MKRKLPLSVDKIIAHIEREYQLSTAFTENKRALYKKRKKLYMNRRYNQTRIRKRLQENETLNKEGKSKFSCVFLWSGN